MTFQNIINSGCVKGMVALCTLQLLSACGEDSAGSPAPPSTISVTMSWTKPANREDGTPILLTDINSYRAYYGKQSGLYLDRVEVLSDGVSVDVTATVSGITPGGELFFVVTTVDKVGRESQFSDQVSIPL